MNLFFNLERQFAIGQRHATLGFIRGHEPDQAGAVAQPVGRSVFRAHGHEGAGAAAGMKFGRGGAVRLFVAQQGVVVVVVVVVGGGGREGGGRGGGSEGGSSGGGSEGSCGSEAGVCGGDGCGGGCKDRG